MAATTQQITRQEFVPSLLVNFTQIGGLGDLFFGVRMIKEIYSLNTQQYPLQITLTTVDDDKKSRRALPNREISDLTGRELSACGAVFNSHQDIPIDQLQNCKLIILGPCHDESRDPIPSLTDRFGAHGLALPPTIVFSEYSNYPLEANFLMEAQSTILETGLGGERVGIFIDEELLQYSRSSLAQSSEGRISLLHGMRDQALVQRMISGRSLVEYDQQQDLYLAYAAKIYDYKTFDATIPESGLHFSLLVAAAQRESRKDIDIVFVNGTRPEGYYLSWIQSCVKYFENSNIQTIIISSTDKPEIICQTHCTSGKKLRILIQDRLNHEDMKILIKASDPLCLITGDQSCGEAISANKKFVYETLTHKTTFYLGLREMSMNPDLTAFIQNWFTITTKQDGAQQQDPDLYLSLARDFRRAESAFPIFNSEIVTKHNIKDCITTAVLPIIFKP
jgi:hypothetical protein